MKLSRAAIPALLWTLLLASSCLLPASHFKRFSFDSLLEVDKIIHLILYFLFYILWAFAISTKNMSITQRISLLIFSIAFGILIECLQAAMNLGRSYELDDIIANSIGAILAALSILFVYRILPVVKKYLPFASFLYR